MSSAPYQVNVRQEDGEALAFSLSFQRSDGTAFPFEDYEIHYVVSQDESALVSLSRNSGISIMSPYATFEAAQGALCAGEYRHDCRIRQVSTGDEVQVFDGAVTISERNAQ